uniref:non-specific serine/threonine protein kinase n=1 Tax=Phallusia mammillata TaxID=59560 RepID=A0A6F9DFJ2_9ASCI|nr:interleukin-1 receptor-associated kinase 4 [Phallusia mammillata]
MMLSRQPNQITPQTYIRKLPYSIMRSIASALDLPGTATNWKDFAQKIPRGIGIAESKYTAHQMRVFEAILNKGNSPTLAIMDDWSTSNATVQDLLDVLHSLELYSLIQMLEGVIQRPPDYQTIVGQPSHMPSTAQSINRPSMYPIQAQPYYSQFRPASMSNLQTPSYMAQPSYQRPIEAQSFSISPMPPSIPERRPVYQRQPTEHESLPVLSLPIENLQLDGSATSYPYSKLCELTSNFSDDLKLGEGAFGSVFKGKLSCPAQTKGGKCTETTEVAIKRLKLDTPEFAQAILEQFKKEVHLISDLQHDNILPLMGYSCDGPELCLVYEFMYNDSLSSNLDACRNGMKILTVSQRLEIGRGSAAGIAYMHDKVVIHRDIKSSNILLDSNMQPRISDFGLIRSTSNTQTSRTSTNTAHPIGTWVYMSPEACKGTVSYAMDVYSFGVVLLELLTGEAVVDESRNPSHLTMYVEESVENDERAIESFFDQHAGIWKPGVGEQLYELSNECLEYKRTKRPIMKKVLARLEELCAMVQLPA